MKFHLRKATKADARRIRRLIWRVRINPTHLDWRRFMIVESSRGEFAGCAQVKPHPDGTRELASLAVVPRFRKTGAARLLIEHFLGIARRPLYLMCRPQLGPFYERFGFRAVDSSRLPRYFRRIRAFSTAVGRIVREEGPLIMRIDEKQP